MDARDCRILAELTRDPFASLEDVGRVVGVSGTAVKSRLDALAARGALLGFAAAPWASAFGRVGRLAVFDGAADADLERLLEVDDVAWAARGHPDSVAVMLYCAREPDAVPPALAKAVGGRSMGLVRPKEPPSAGPLSPLDWRVVDALLQEPRATLARHADLAGLAPKTVRPRREALFAAGTMVTPVVDATREQGEVFFNAHVGGRDRATLRRIRAPGCLRIVDHDEPPGAYLVGHAPTYAAVQDVERQLRGIDGVTHVALTVPKGMLVATERLRGWVAAELERWRAARPRA